MRAVALTAHVSFGGIRVLWRRYSGAMAVCRASINENIRKPNRKALAHYQVSDPEKALVGKSVFCAFGLGPWAFSLQSSRVLWPC